MIDIDEFEKRLKEIPLGNSAFQNSYFSSDEKPERMYRSALLQINSKLDALQESKYRRDLTEIEIEEIEYKMNKLKKWPPNDDVPDFETPRLQVELQRKKYHLHKEIKMIEDAEIEIMTHWNKIKDIPIISRLDFERAEGGYWENRLKNDAAKEMLALGFPSKGTLDALEKIGIEAQRDTFGAIQYIKKDDKMLIHEPPSLLEANK